MGRKAGGGRIRSTRLDRVRSKRVEWLWKGVIPRDSLSLLHGPPGCGKSTIAIDIAARVTTGAPMPLSEEPGQAAAVILLSAEDSLPSTIRPRLDAAGAVARSVHSISTVPDRSGERLPRLPGDIPELERLVTETGAALVIIDVLDAFLGGSGSSMASVRASLTPLTRMAERTNCAVLALGHHAKRTGRGPALYGALGSVGIVGAARSALVLGRNPEYPEQIALAHAKSNFSRLSPTLLLRLLDKDGVGCVEWLGHADDLTADDLLSGESRRSTARNQARTWLESVLEPGPRLASELEKLARRDGLSWSGSVRRAKDELGIEPRKTAEGWIWALPGQAAQDGQDVQGEQDVPERSGPRLTLVPAPPKPAGE